MELLDLIKKRRSVRKFRNVLIEKDKLMKVLQAGHWAPTAGNLQSWKFIVVKEKKTREEIAEAAFNQMWLTEAPVLIIIGAELAKIKRYYGVRGERLYAVQECAAAIENMIIEAESLNLSTCWVGAFDEAAIKRILEIPDSTRPQAIVALGYGDETPPVPSKYGLKDVVYFEKFKQTREEFFPLEKQAKFVAERAEPFIERVKGKFVDIITKRKK
jgi:nitroreductase